MFQPNITPVSRRRLQEQRKKSREATQTEKALFEDCISKVSDLALRKELDNIIKVIQKEGDRLHHFRSVSQLEHYKSKVQEFMQKAHRATFKLKAIGFTDHHGDYSTQTVVEKVDNALADLTRLVLGKETQSMMILQKLDLIKGLLTDLYQ